MGYQTRQLLSRMPRITVHNIDFSDHLRLTAGYFAYSYSIVVPIG